MGEPAKMRSEHSMHAFIFLLSLLLTYPQAARAQGVQIQRLDVTDYGLYTLDREISGRDAQGISLGTATNIQHNATQRNVPAQIGVTFGFRYKVVGKPAGATVDLKKVINFPAPGLLTPNSSNRVSKAEFDVEAKIGDTNSELYTLEENFELVSGVWVLEMWQGSRKLLSQPFKLEKEGEKEAQKQKPERAKPDQRKTQSAKPESDKPAGCVSNCDGL
jgi:hypothetical protein